MLTVHVVIYSIQAGHGSPGPAQGGDKEATEKTGGQWHGTASILAQHWLLPSEYLFASFG